MIYLDKRTNVIKHPSEVERRVRYLQENDAFGYEDIDDYIKTNFIVLDNHEDDEEIRSRLREIEHINEEIQELKREIEEYKKEVEEIVQKYPEEYWSRVTRQYNIQ